ncbi:DUF120 domain-containing protein [Candidatus Woesearchaeota archaeon]|nr:DUF120 domain-containing protein [Candidatus Woesearchaeota archaeon]
MFDLLLYLGDKTELFGNLNSSTVTISKDIGISQQSVSRKLIELEQSGMIKRQASTSGITLSLSEKGRNRILDHFEYIRKIVDRNRVESFSGRVQTGIRQGKYYVKKYSDKFSEVLGFEPFHGTLNLDVNRTLVKKFVNQLESFKILGFEDELREFGPVLCYEIELGINGKALNGALIVPERTKHPENIIEILAPINVREHLKVKDDDEILIRKVKK